MELLSSKELAATLKRHLTYVYAMRRRGFHMPGNRTTLRAAIAWLSRHPPPRSTKSR